MTLDPRSDTLWKTYLVYFLVLLGIPHTDA